MQALSTEKGFRVYLETFGCQMNENDSSRMLGILKGIDYLRAGTPEEADLIVLNTCSVRDKAEQKVYSTLGRYRALKELNPSLLICVAGCVAQQKGEELLKRVEYLDLVVGPHNVHRIAELLEEASRGSRLAATALNDTLGPEEFSYPVESDGVKAFVSIMRGCDNFCAYCIVPFTRGREASRASSEILKEVAALSEGGVREVTLLGQNVNSYGRTGDVTFPELLRRVSGVEGIERVRFITSHPKDISVELIRLFGEEPRLARHIHLPVQSGSDAVLGRMGRNYTRKEYIEKVEMLKGLYEDISITTDIIVGFPGETEKDFEETMDLLREVRYDSIFSFMYSQRPGTRASDLDGQLPVEVRSERLKLLQELQRGITMEKSRELVGREVSVLIEGPSRNDPDESTGRTSCNRVINFHAAGRPAGSMADLIVTAAYPNSLRGRLSKV